MELQKSELIAKLDDILAKYTDVLDVKDEMNNFEPEDHYAREVEVPEFPGEYDTEKMREIWRDKLDHTYEGAVEVAEKTHREVFAPKEPKKLRLSDFESPVNATLKAKQEKYKGVSYIGAGIGIFFFLGMISCIQSGDFDVLPTIIIIALAGAAAFLFFRKKCSDVKAEEEKEIAEALLAHNRQQEERKAEHAEQMKAYEDECKRYELRLFQFLEDYKAWRDIYLQSVEEEARIADKLEADRAAAVEKIYEERYVPAEMELNKSNDLVSKEYLPVLRIIIDLLRSGRADDLKEAINLYEDIVYRERQLALEREKEAQRQYEEQQRRQDEERRHKEDMALREKQEQQRQREEEQRRQDEERRHKEDMALREKQERDRQDAERRRAEEDRRRADRAEAERRQREDRDTRDQCNRCAQNGHCSMAYRRPNCASFRPR